MAGPLFILFIYFHHFFLLLNETWWQPRLSDVNFVLPEGETLSRLVPIVESFGGMIVSEGPDSVVARIQTGDLLFFKLKNALPLIKKSANKMAGAGGYNVGTVEMKFKIHQSLAGTPTFIFLFFFGHVCMDMLHVLFLEQGRRW